MSDGISHQDMKEAIGRLASTHDGELLYLWFQKQLMATPSGSVTDGGLRELHGRRMLVAELIAMMSEGIKLSGRSDDTRPIVFRLAGPERSGDARPRFAGPGRRVTADTYVPGYSDPDDAPGARSE